MNELEKAIMRVLDAYKSAVYAKDVDAFVGLYDHEVRVFDLWDKWSYNGIEAWRGMATGWFSSLGTERSVVEIEEVKITATDKLAIAHGFITYKGVSAEGKELRAIQNRLTWVLKQEGGAWKILHEHTSAPVNIETSKVILQR